MKKQNCMILGCNGYLGHALTIDLLNDGHKVIGVDNDLKKYLLKRDKIKPVLHPEFKIPYNNKDFILYNIDVGNKKLLSEVMQKHKVDTIFVFSHIPSAPFSMRNYESASFTMKNNIDVTLSIIYSVAENCPDAHIITLGSMGEYPHHCGVPIPEGDFQFEYKGYKSVPLPFPKTGGSLYHISKTAMSNMNDFCAKAYNLKISDIYQGVIYGVNTDLCTSHYYIDETWGTVINRFVSQAIINMPLTIFGDGAQRRTYLSLQDAIKCYKLIMNNPPKNGVCEIYNQFDEEYSVNELAEKVKKIGKEFDLDVEFKNWDNPRIEPKQKNYMPINEKLKNLGYKRTNDLIDELKDMFRTLIPQKEEILKLSNVLEPTTKWSETKNE